MPGLLPGSVRQNGYVVTDLDQAIEHWWSVLGVGPWFPVRNLVLSGSLYRGTPADTEISLAVANSGDLQIELIEAQGDEPCCYREFLDSGPAGLHHVAWWTEDFDSTMQRAKTAGWGVIQEGDAMGTRFCYFDCNAPRGAIPELMELNELSRWLIDTVRDASRDWDGHTDPVRNLL